MTKSQADKRLLAAFLGEEPLDWSRRPNGDLVFLNRSGQKFVLTAPTLQRLAGHAPEKKITPSSPCKSDASKPSMASSKKKAE